MQVHATRPLPAAPVRRTTSLAAGIGPRALILLLLAAALWAGLVPFAATPAIVPADAPQALFSAARALRHVEVIAAEPHPIGSERSAALRDYLLEELRALGLEPEVQRTLLMAGGDIAEVALVENVLARIPGTGRGKAVLISGHYDSVPTSAGASDCSGCAAAVLEAARALRAGEPLANDLIVLLTDGEEVVAAGARAFMRQHPWASDVAVSLVLEGMGTGGGSMLYISDRQGGWFAREALRAAPHALGYSLIHETMWSLAGNTGSDLDGFLEDGGHGLGFLALSLTSGPAYHTLDDQVARLDAGSVQAHGEWLVSLARHFGNLPLENPPVEPPLLMFPLLPGVVVRYGVAWAMPLALAGAVVWLAAVWVARARRRLALRGLAAGAVLTLLALVNAVLVVTLVWWLLRLANPGLHSFRVGGWYGAEWYLAAWAALALAVVAAWRLLWRRVAAGDLAAGALFWWALVALLAAWALPGMSYLFAWPLLAASAALLWWGLRREKRAGPWAVALVAGIPAAVAALLGVQLVYAFGVFAGRVEALAGLNLAALPAPMLVLMAALALPALEALLGGRRGWLAPGALAAAGALLVAAWLVSMPTAQRPATNALLYWLDADAGTARWITLNDTRGGRSTRTQLDAWTAQYFTQGAEAMIFRPWINGWSDLEYPALQGPAPVVALPRSSARLVADTTAGDTRTLRVEVTTPDSVLDGQIVIEATAPVAHVAIGGGKLRFGSANRQALQINRYGRTGTLPLEIGLPAGASATLVLRDRSMGLPAVEGLDAGPRPPSLVPAPFNAVSDSAIVEQRVRF